MFLNCFTMTFIAEWGDRSQLATIVLAGMNNVWGVIVGQCLLDFSQCSEKTPTLQLRIYQDRYYASQGCSEHC